MNIRTLYKIFGFEGLCIFAISSASLIPFLIWFSFQKTFIFYFKKINYRFHYFSFTIYSQSYSNIKFNKSFHNKYFLLISCSYVHSLKSYAQKKKTIKQVVTLILDMSVYIYTYINIYIYIKATFSFSPPQA